MATTGNTRPKVLLVATQDTKEEEARFLRRHLEDYGCDVVHLDRQRAAHRRRRRNLARADRRRGRQDDRGGPRARP